MIKSMTQQLTINTFNHTNQRDRILQMLKDHDFVSTSSLRLFAYQYNARIKELRVEFGHDKIISCKQDGVFGFRWVE